MSFRCVALVLIGAALLACDRERQRAPSASTSSSASVALAPLSAPSWLVDLDVPGFERAKVAVPLGARAPRPVIVAIHGDHDRPEWHCGTYRHVSGPRSFVLCPSGAPKPGRDRFTLSTHAVTAAELRAALSALKQRYGAHVAKDGLVLAGLGPGVEHAIDIAREEPSFFSRLVLVDGSLARLSTGVVARYGQNGGERALIACSGGCATDVESKLFALRSAGVAARLMTVENARGLDAHMAARLKENWTWLVSGAPRWQ